MATGRCRSSSRKSEDGDADHDHEELHEGGSASSSQSEPAPPPPPVAPRTKITTYLFFGWVLVGWMLLSMSRIKNGEHGIKMISSAIYLQVQIFTTVGYGEMTPDNDLARFILAWYVLAGNIIVGLGVTDYLTDLMAKGESKVKKDLLSSSVSKSASLQSLVSRHRWMTKYRSVFSALSGYVLMIAVGTVFYSTVDYCRCDDYRHCNRVMPLRSSKYCEEELGGTVRTVVQAFYMSCITLTTVGFGDEAPGNWIGRLFAIFWMPFGVASMGIFLAELAHLQQTHHIRRTVAAGIDDETFNMLDNDQNEHLDKNEFVINALVKFGIVDSIDVDMLTSMFDELDKTGDGILTREEVSTRRIAGEF